MGELWKILRSGNSIPSSSKSGGQGGESKPVEAAVAVAVAAQDPHPTSTSTNIASKKKSKNKKKSNSKNETTQPVVVAVVTKDKYDYGDDDDDAMIFATDKEITARKQKEYESHRLLVTQYEKDITFCNHWVSSLPNPIGFKIPNANQIID